VQPERAPMWFSVSTVAMVIVAALFFRPEAGEGAE
jgi:hypothetical protein